MIITLLISLFNAIKGLFKLVFVKIPKAILKGIQAAIKAVKFLFVPGKKPQKKYQKKRR